MVAILELSGGFRKPHSTDMLQICHPVIDLHFILLHVELEDELVSSILKQDNLIQKFTIVLFFFFFFDPPRLFQALMCVVVSQDLEHRCMPKFTKKSKPI
jgi:hypothetical protein